MKKFKIFGERLKAARISAGLTQDNLAVKCNELTGEGFKRNTISNYETGFSFPTLENLSHIAKILDVTADYLIGLSDEPKNTYLNTYPSTYPTEKAKTDPTHFRGTQNVPNNVPNDVPNKEDDYGKHPDLLPAAAERMEEYFYKEAAGARELAKQVERLKIEKETLLEALTAVGRGQAVKASNQGEKQ